MLLLTKEVKENWGGVLYSMQNSSMLMEITGGHEISPNGIPPTGFLPQDFSHGIPPKEFLPRDSSQWDSSHTGFLPHRIPPTHASSRTGFLLHGIPPNQDPSQLEDTDVKRHYICFKLIMYDVSFISII